MNSLLKYAGSKYWLREQYPHLLPLPTEINTYREPFLGAAGVASGYIGKVACVLSDANTRLMAMYRGVRDDPEEVIQHLRSLIYPEDYYRVRERFNTETVSNAVTAARFVFLNKTCFNGLYRENQDGEFNVPVGRFNNPKFCDEETIRAWSDILKPTSIVKSSPKALLYHADFRSMLAEVEEEDLVFLDPPYVPISKTANFTKYTGTFGTKEQEELVAELTVIDSRRATFLLTNSDTPETRAMYSRWNMVSVIVPRSISAKGKERSPVRELIVSNRPIPWTEEDKTNLKKGLEVVRA